VISSGNRWPTFFIVGAQKCGTTSLYKHLKKHPEVFLPEVKEPAFFVTRPQPGEPRLFPEGCTTLEEYSQLYLGAEKFAAIGDASPHYLCDEGSPRRIHDACPQARIIIMLRDPVIRAHSAYLMNRGRDYDSAPTFRQALERDEERDKTSWYTSWQYVQAGMYHAQVSRYLDAFSSAQVLILLFDDLRRDPNELLSRIARHIGINPAPFGASDLSEPYNYFKMPRFRTAYRIARTPLGRKIRQKLFPESVQQWLRRSSLLYGDRKPPLDDESRQYLQTIYDPDVARLEGLLGRELPELRTSWK
jgi:hypothetical protein